mmetsp:Transcript_13088/g.11569  ORF Transcript_13088/g.11569 Transcript_13088/m.11569 type:complete len:100 (+) Transcript_13088:21-320(+)
MENLTDQNLYDYLFNRKPPVYSRIIDYDEVSINFGKELKIKILAKLNEENELCSDLIDVASLSNHYFHMLLHNWRIICFSNKDIVDRLLKLYKTISTLA